MKKIIDMPDDWEKRIGEMLDFQIVDFLYGIIRNGMSLSKGHGRIIDESQITGTFTWDNGYIECFAPTIIEADKAESEG